MSNVDRKKVIQNIVSKQNARRKILDKAFTYATVGCVVLAMIPLGSILMEVVKNGAPAISAEFLTLPPGKIFVDKDDIKDCLERGIPEVRCETGGIGPAIQGTLVVVGYATLIGVPIGVLTGVYLSEYAGNNRFARSVRFFNSVMTGLPSIVIGIVGFVTIVVATGFSITAGAFALSIIMIPIVVGVTEETLKLVPNSVREAGHSLGIPKWKVTIFITLSSAKNGVLTGIVLAISRIAGETAPLIMTVLGASLFIRGPFGPIDAIPLRIWRLSQLPQAVQHDIAWGGALILIIIILSLSIGLRLLLQKRLRLKMLPRMRIN